MWSAVRPWLFPVWCLACGTNGVALCDACAPSPADRRATIAATVPVVAAGAYAGVLRDAIVALKRGERAYLDPLASLLARTLPFDAPLIPLPTTRSRRAARGFDQAVELARRVGRSRGTPVHDVLVKRGAAQRGLGRLARLEAAGRFRLRAGAPLPAYALVIDDVCTTGATLSDAIGTLRAARIAVVGAAVLACA